MSEYDYEGELKFLVENMRVVLPLMAHCPTDFLLDSVVQHQRIARIYEQRLAVYEKLTDHVQRNVDRELDSFDLTEVREINRQSRVLADECYRIINAMYAEINQRDER